MISLIWAMDENQLVGNGDKIPWHIKEDLIYYKSKTKGQIVLMGDTTYFSLRGYYKDKPLPYGKIYVATIDKNLKIETELNEVIMVYDLIPFLENNREDLWVVGGATIYKLSLPYADKLYISFVKGTHEGDRYFPTIDFSKYNLVWENNTNLVRYTIFEKVK
ncbi:MAG: dihydrofolate reductase [Acholeplasmatales bacterium]|nr:dihydrofolate reductase [Acholeplasmatales bacterium]